MAREATAARRIENKKLIILIILEVVAAVVTILTAATVYSSLYRQVWSCSRQNQYKLQEAVSLHGPLTLESHILKQYALDLTKKNLSDITAQGRSQATDASLEKKLPVRHCFAFFNNPYQL